MRRPTAISGYQISNSGFIRFLYSRRKLDKFDPLLQLIQTGNIYERSEAW